MTNPDSPPSPQQSSKPKKQPLMRALGQSAGILWNAIRKPVANKAAPKNQASDNSIIRREVIEESSKEISHDSMTIRETRTREIEYRSSPPLPPARSEASDGGEEDPLLIEEQVQNDERREHE